MRTATFALIMGIAYLAAGVLGLTPAALEPPPPDAPPTRLALLYGYLIGLFPVNILHTAVHLAIGVWGLAAWRGATDPKLYARSLAMLYGVLAVMGLIPGLNTVYGLIPLHSHDVWLHAGTAALAAYFGWRKEVNMKPRTTGERRQRMIPVARERRLGVTDRREFGYNGA
jgi:Domain of unknown function (DUF4383)